MSNESIGDALKMMPYGFYALTSRHDDDLNAMVANWISQVGFEPRFIVVGLQKTAYSHKLISKGQVFTLNIFRKEDQDNLLPFTKSRAKNPDKMKDASYDEAPETGCPILEGAAAYIEFSVKDIIDIGTDHDLLIGKPVNAAILKEGEAEDTLTLPDIGWSYAG